MYIRVGGLGLVCFLFTGVDQFPILSGLQCHLAEKSVLAFELSADDLSEEEDFGDEIGFCFKVVDVVKGR